MAEGPRGLDLLAAHQPITAHVHVVPTGGGCSVQRDAVSETGGRDPGRGGQRPGRGTGTQGKGWKRSQRPRPRTSSCSARR